MQRSTIIIALTVVALWQLAGNAAAQAPDDAAPSAGARYQVFPFGRNSAVMIDGQTGQSWKLERDGQQQGSFVWLPIRKLSTNMEIDQWNERMKKFREVRRKRRMERLRDDAIPELPELP